MIRAFFDEALLAFEVRALEFDVECLAEDLDRIGVGMQCSRDGHHEHLFVVGLALDGFLDHGLPCARWSDK